ADAVSGAADESALPAAGRFAIGTIPGFRAYAELSAGQPDTAPADRSAGQVMNYTSGTTGPPKGVRRPLPLVAPDPARPMFGICLGLSGSQPKRDTVHLCGSPLYHPAVLLFAASSLHLGHAVVLMDKWTPEGSLGIIERHRVTTSHMVPTQLHRLLALPDVT